MIRINVEKLKKLRNAVPLTQPEFAEKIGLKRSTYAYKEKIGEFTDEEVKAIVRFFQIPRHDIVEKEVNGNSRSYAEEPEPPENSGGLTSKYISRLEKEVERLEKENIALRISSNENQAILLARTRTMLQCLSLLRSKICKESEKVAQEEINRLYSSNFEEVLRAGN